MQIPVAQRRAPALSLQQIASDAPDRNTAIATAYATGAYSYQRRLLWNSFHDGGQDFAATGLKCYIARPDPKTLNPATTRLVLAWRQRHWQSLILLQILQLYSLQLHAALLVWSELRHVSLDLAVALWHRN